MFGELDEGFPRVDEGAGAVNGGLDTTDGGAPLGLLLSQALFLRLHSDNYRCASSLSFSLCVHVRTAFLMSSLSALFFLMYSLRGCTTSARNTLLTCSNMTLCVHHTHAQGVYAYSVSCAYGCTCRRQRSSVCRGIRSPWARGSRRPPHRCLCPSSSFSSSYIADQAQHTTQTHTDTHRHTHRHMPLSLPLSSRVWVAYFVSSFWVVFCFASVVLSDLRECGVGEPLDHVRLGALAVLQ